MAHKQSIHTEVCVAGGGPAGIMLGYLLARAGIDVVVLEKHPDFLRDFRGDTVHPSTLEVLAACGLKEKFDALPQRRIQDASVRIGDARITFGDFRGLHPFDYLALVPQWDFLDLLAAEADRLATFRLLVNHEVTDLLIEQGTVTGVRARTANAAVSVQAPLVVGCDGRDSTVRKRLGREVRDLGAPMDVLWFRLPRATSDSSGLEAILGAGQMMVMIDRDDYWQVAYVVSKGRDRALRAQPISRFHELIASLSPALRERCRSISAWNEVKTLVVSVDRLEHWYGPGVLIIGDAAHAMSPVGGIGINLAIQDAVAAANIIAGARQKGTPLDEHTLARVQQRRQWPTRLLQAVQIIVQKRVISGALEKSATPPEIPRLLRWLSRFPWVRRIPARIIGYGFRREHVDTRKFRY